MPSLSIANNLSQADNKAKASTLAPLASKALCIQVRTKFDVDCGRNSFEVS